MTTKNFSQHVKFGEFPTMTCAEAQAINRKLTNGEHVSGEQFAHAVDHTHTCATCRNLLKSLLDSMKALY